MTALRGSLDRFKEVGIPKTSRVAVLTPHTPLTEWGNAIGHRTVAFPPNLVSFCLDSCGELDGSFFVNQ
jgi:hypothetical protein